jgi:cell division protein FtsW (lipid II flippase)/cell division protein FtsI/penicillin-binding protein 2
MTKAGTIVAAADAPTPAVRRPLRRRGVELALLVVAVLLSVCGYCAVGLARHGTVPPGAAGYGAGLGALALLAHVAVRLRAPYADPLLLPIGVLLNGLGLVLIYRLDLETPGDAAAPAQLVWSALGVLLFTAVVLLLRDHRVLQRYAYVCVVAALALLTLPILFPAVNGARIWIRLAGFSLQPGEFAKVLLAVFFAAYLAANRSALAYAGRRLWRLQLPAGRVIGPLLAIWLLSVGVLVLERDLGTSLLFFGLFVVMLYVATGLTGWIALGLVLAVLGAVAVARLEPHVHVRVEDWLHPFASIRAGLGPNQIAQSLFAFAAGGVLGTGLGLGHSILIGFAAKSDFVLATAGEELGLAGLAAVYVLYALLVERGYRAGLALRDAFGRLLAVGLASIVALQVFVIAGGVTGLIPLTGMAMPFLAQGGSSVVTNWAIVALLIRLSDRARRTPVPDGPPGPMTRCIRHAGALCAVLLAALLVNAFRVQVVQAGSLDRSPANRRDAIARYAQPRGDIVVDGRAVTGSRDTHEPLRYERTYPDGPLYAPVTGFSSQQYGTTLLEHAADGVLSGTDPLLASLPLPGRAAGAGAGNPAGDVVTTLDAAAQRAAYDGLGGRRGAVAAIEPATGRILALVSSPSYDPGELSGNGPSVRRAWARLNADETRPMLNRAVRQTYPPGSTFKVVTAAAALEARVVTDVDARTRTPSPYRLPGTTTSLTNEASGCGGASLRYAFAWSCNTVFAKLGVDVGADRMGATAAAFGFNDPDLRIPFAVAPSSFDTHVDRAQLALSSIGQYNTRATPLQMAMVAAAVADHGLLRPPYLVERTVRGNGTVVATGGARPGRQVMRPATAERLRELMADAVRRGTGRTAAIPHTTVGGKTGTAQHGVGNAGVPYAWFVSWAQREEDLQAKVAVAVVVEDATARRGDISGGGVAAPIARAVMEAVLHPGGRR